MNTVVGETHGGATPKWKTSVYLIFSLGWFLNPKTKIYPWGGGGGYMDDLWIYEETRPLIIRIYKPQSSQILISPENLWIHHIY